MTFRHRCHRQPETIRLLASPTYIQAPYDGATDGETRRHEALRPPLSTRSVLGYACRSRRWTSPASGWLPDIHRDLSKVGSTNFGKQLNQRCLAPNLVTNKVSPAVGCMER